MRESPAPVNIPTPTPAPDRGGPVACQGGPVAMRMPCVSTSNAYAMCFHEQLLLLRKIAVKSWEKH